MQCFEPKKVRAVAMLERIVTMLEPLAADINPKFFLVQVKELNFECGEVMATVQDIYAGKVRAVANAGGTPRNKDVRKSNAAGKRAVHFFNQFLSTMHDKDGKPKEGRVPNHKVGRPAKLSHRRRSVHIAGSTLKGCECGAPPSE